MSAGHPFVTSKNVKDGYINYDDIQYISDEDYEAINKRSRVDINDILMGMIGTIGNLALIRTEPDFAIKNVALIKDTKQVSYIYLYHYLQTPNTVLQLLSGLDGGTQKFVSLKNIRELNIMVPSETEQLKVGTFIEALDNLITLHQRKYEKLLTVKKSMLEKMFPRDGSNNPEISAKEYTASGIPVINVKNIGTGCIQENDLDYVSESTAKRLSDHIIQENDIVFGRKGAIGRHAIIGKTQNNWVQGSDCIRVRFKPGIVASYVNAQLQTANVIDHLSMNAYGSTMLTLTTDMINSIPLLMPKEAEQSEIAHVFSDIDNLITLHHLKLEKLKNIKQSLLQNMFV